MTTKNYSVIYLLRGETNSCDHMYLTKEEERMILKSVKRFLTLLNNDELSGIASFPYHPISDRHVDSENHTE
jgi:hypothetical protein